MRRTRKEAEQTRKNILEAALVVFHDKGVSSASLVEIADRAGVTRGAVYWHFRDKQDLYFALYDSLTEEYEARPEDYGKKEYADLDDFIADVRRPLVLLKTDARFRMFFSIVYSRMEYVEAMAPIIENEQRKQRALVEAFIHALDNLQNRGFIDADVDTRRFAYILYSFVDGAFDSVSFDSGFYPDSRSPDRLLADLFQTVRRSDQAT